MADKPTPAPVKILQEGPFIQVPRYMMELMGSHSRRGDRHAECLSPSFWKFYLFLWGWIMNGNPNREASIAMRQFPMRTDAATKWTAAISVSGLFFVTKGKNQGPNSVPTHFRLNVEAGQADWSAFVCALDLAEARLKGGDSFGRNTKHGNTGSYAVYVANAVDDLRARRGLPPVNVQFLNDAADGKIKDMEGRPIAQRDKDGSVTAISYDGRGANRLHLFGHKRHCDCYACEEFRRTMIDEVVNTDVAREPY
jgi:hypothetical protein